MRSGLRAFFRDGSGTARDAYIQSVRWNFFDTMGIPLSSGRGLSRGDSSMTPRVAIINDTMAAQVFGDRHPIGRHFRFLTGRDRNVAIEVYGMVSFDVARRTHEIGVRMAIGAERLCDGE